MTDQQDQIIKLDTELDTTVEDLELCDCFDITEDEILRSEEPTLRLQDYLDDDSEQCISDCIGFDDPNLFLQARDLFHKANYHEVGIVELLGCKVPAAPTAEEMPPFVLRTNGRTRLETLIRLFLLNVPTDLAVTRGALHPMSLEQWVQAGLVRIQDETVVPRVRIVPFQELLLASDISQNSEIANHPDFVMGVGGSSLALMNATIRKPVESTLDLGTGCGVQAFLAASHSRRVIAVDRNPRALNFARFNAALNGIMNVEFREGDLFNPVRDCRFDQILFNLPFVISPTFQALYRDNEMSGDLFCQEVIRQVPRYLNEGGYCQVICNWVRRSGQKWQRRLAHWFEGTDCHAWVMRTETRNPSDYALFWLQKEAGTPEFTRRYDEWMTYYREERIEAISTGLITMRKSSGQPNWYRADDAPERISGSYGDDVLLGFELQDFLETVRDDQALLQARLQVSGDIRLEQQYRPSAQGWKVSGGRVCRTKGLGYAGNIDLETADLLLEFDGQRSVEEVLNGLAQRRNTSFEAVSGVYLDVLRKLIIREFLAPTNSGQEKHSLQTWTTFESDQTEPLTVTTTL